VTQFCGDERLSEEPRSRSCLSLCRENVLQILIDAGRRQAPATTEEGTVEELYWRFLAASLVLAALGTLFLRERTELWIQLLAAAGTGAAIWGVIAI